MTAFFNEPVHSTFSRALSQLCLLMACVSSISAQDVDSLRKAMLVQLPNTIEVAATAARSAPGSSAGSPTAFGANYGDGFVGAGFQAETRDVRGGLKGRSDGTVVAGFGLGNSRDALGLEVAITSLSTLRRSEGFRYSASLKVHRVLQRNIGVAVGWENAVVTGTTDAGHSFYGVASKVFKLRERRGDPLSSATLSVGLGNGRFRSEDDVYAGKSGVNVFGSMGVRLLEQAAAIADWTGQDLTLALSLVPFVRVPVVITPGFADVTGRAGSGARFTLGIGVGFKFSRIRDIFLPGKR